MPEIHAYAIYAVFAAVIVCVALNLMDMTLAALLGLCALTLAGIVTQPDIMRSFVASEGALALLFGGMVVARVLAPTGIFENAGTRLLILTRGSGRRFLLYLTVLVSVVCAVLPNATAVILVAPIIIRVCRELDVDFAGPMILTAMLSNAAGLLTLVGDPATFLVGQAAGLTFTEYLRKVSLGGVMAILVLVPLMPLLFRQVWRARKELPEDLVPPPLERPFFCILALLALAFMVAMFLIGDSLPQPVIPPAAAIMGASLALLAIQSSHVEPLDNVFKDVDWKTIIFIFCMMCYVEQITKTGVLSGLSRSLHAGFGDNLLLAGMALLAGIGLASAFLANIPVVAAAVLMTKGYLVLLTLVPEEALGATFTDWPDASLPVFVAMMFGGTLGGNATLIGSSANLVSVGICGAQGRPVRFAEFARYGVPATCCQLAASAVYVWLLSKTL
jgi:Na+/H+ antiporter NhaD/arsenite permease-like protein